MDIPKGTIKTPQLLSILQHFYGTEFKYSKLDMYFKRNLFAYDSSRIGAGKTREFTFYDVIIIKSTIDVMNIEKELAAGYVVSNSIKDILRSSDGLEFLQAGVLFVVGGNIIQTTGKKEMSSMDMYLTFGEKDKRIEEYLESGALGENTKRKEGAPYYKVPVFQTAIQVMKLWEQ